MPSKTNQDIAVGGGCSQCEWTVLLCIFWWLIIAVNKLNLQHSSEDLNVSGSDSGRESWKRQGSGSNNTSTVPVGLTMMSPETPTDPRPENDRWSDVEYTDSEPEVDKNSNQHTSPIEVCYIKCSTDLWVNSVRPWAMVHTPLTRAVFKGQHIDF